MTGMLEKLGMRTFTKYRAEILVYSTQRGDHLGDFGAKQLAVSVSSRVIVPCRLVFVVCRTLGGASALSARYSIPRDKCFFGGCDLPCFELPRQISRPERHDYSTDFNFVILKLVSTASGLSP